MGTSNAFMYIRERFYYESSLKRSDFNASTINEVKGRVLNMFGWRCVDCSGDFNGDFNDDLI